MTEAEKKAEKEKEIRRRIVILGAIRRVATNQPHSMKAGGAAIELKRKKEGVSVKNSVLDEAVGQDNRKVINRAAADSKRLVRWGSKGGQVVSDLRDLANEKLRGKDAAAKESWRLRNHRSNAVEVVYGGQQRERRKKRFYETTSFHRKVMGVLGTAAIVAGVYGAKKKREADSLRDALSREPKPVGPKPKPPTAHEAAVIRDMTNPPTRGKLLIKAAKLTKPTLDSGKTGSINISAATKAATKSTVKGAFKGAAKSAIKRGIRR